MVHSCLKLKETPMLSAANAIKYAAVGVKTVLIPPTLTSYQEPDYALCRQ
jgi:hypothetical protein